MREDTRLRKSSTHLEQASELLNVRILLHHESRVKKFSESVCLCVCLHVCMCVHVCFCIGHAICVSCRLYSDAFVRGALAKRIH